MHGGACAHTVCMYQQTDGTCYAHAVLYGSGHRPIEWLQLSSFHSLSVLPLNWISFSLSVMGPNWKHEVSASPNSPTVVSHLPDTNRVRITTYCESLLSIPEGWECWESSHCAVCYPVRSCSESLLIWSCCISSLFIKVLGLWERCKLNKVLGKDIISM